MPAALFLSGRIRRNPCLSVFHSPLSTRKTIGNKGSPEDTGRFRIYPGPLARAYGDGRGQSIEAPSWLVMRSELKKPSNSRPYPVMEGYCRRRSPAWKRFLLALISDRFRRLWLNLLGRWEGAWAMPFAPERTRSATRRGRRFNSPNNSNRAKAMRLCSGTSPRPWAGNHSSADEWFAKVINRPLCDMEAPS